MATNLQVLIDTWLAYTPRRFFSLWLRHDRHATAAARRIKLTEAMRRILLRAYPMNCYWAEQDLGAWMQDRTLHASIEDAWHQSLECARLMRQAGLLDEARRHLESARWRRTTRLANGRLRAI